MVISCSVHGFCGVGFRSMFVFEVEDEVVFEYRFGDEGIRDNKCAKRGGGVPSGTCTGISHCAARADIGPSSR